MSSQGLVVQWHNLRVWWRQRRYSRNIRYVLPRCVWHLKVGQIPNKVPGQDYNWENYEIIQSCPTFLNFQDKWAIESLTINLTAWLLYVWTWSPEVDSKNQGPRKLVSNGIDRCSSWSQVVWIYGRNQDRAIKVFPCWGSVIN